MNITVITDGCPFEREIERLCGLFYEEADIRVVDVTAANTATASDIRIELRLKREDNRLLSYGELVAQDQRETASHAKDVAQDADAVTVRKRGKQTVLHVLHQLLEAVTNEHQPWGILTGVRPLKLVHRMVERGLTETEDPQAIVRRIPDLTRAGGLVIGDCWCSTAGGSRLVPLGPRGEHLRGDSLLSDTLCVLYVSRLLDDG